MSKTSKMRRDMVARKMRRDMVARKKHAPHQSGDAVAFGGNRNNEKSKIFLTDDMEASLYTIAMNVKNGLKSVIATKKGYERAGIIAMMVSDECAKLGVCLRPCDIPIGIQPTNKNGVFYTWMPSQYHTGKECDAAPVRIIINDCYRYNGMDADGNFMLENLKHCASG